MIQSIKIKNFLYSQIDSPIGYYPVTVQGTSDYQNAIMSLIDEKFNASLFNLSVNLFTSSARGASIYKRIPIGDIKSSGDFLRNTFVY